MGRVSSDGAILTWPAELSWYHCHNFRSKMQWKQGCWTLEFQLCWIGFNLANGTLTIQNSFGVLKAKKKTPNKSVQSLNLGRLGWCWLWIMAAWFSSATCSRCAHVFWATHQSEVPPEPHARCKHVLVLSWIKHTCGNKFLISPPSFYSTILHQCPCKVLVGATPSNALHSMQTFWQFSMIGLPHLLLQISR